MCLYNNILNRPEPNAVQRIFKKNYRFPIHIL